MERDAVPMAGASICTHDAPVRLTTSRFGLRHACMVHTDVKTKVYVTNSVPEAQACIHVTTPVLCLNSCRPMRPMRQPYLLTMKLSLHAHCEVASCAQTGSSPHLESSTPSLAYPQVISPCLQPCLPMLQFPPVKQIKRQLIAVC